MVPFSEMRKTVGEEGRSWVGRNKSGVLSGHVHSDMYNSCIGPQTLYCLFHLLPPSAPLHKLWVSLPRSDMHRIPRGRVASCRPPRLQTRHTKSIDLATLGWTLDKGKWEFSGRQIIKSSFFPLLGMTLRYNIFKQFFRRSFVCWVDTTSEGPSGTLGVSWWGGSRDSLGELEAGTVTQQLTLQHTFLCLLPLFLLLPIPCAPPDYLNPCLRLCFIDDLIKTTSKQKSQVEHWSLELRRRVRIGTTNLGSITRPAVFGVTRLAQREGVTDVWVRKKTWGTLKSHIWAEVGGPSWGELRKNIQWGRRKSEGV